MILDEIFQKRRQGEVPVGEWHDEVLPFSTGTQVPASSGPVEERGPVDDGPSGSDGGSQVPPGSDEDGADTDPTSDDE